jgi:hypothetical protein
MCPVGAYTMKIIVRYLESSSNQSLNTKLGLIKTLNRAQDGRAAMEMLRNHFDGPGEIEKRIAEANQAIDDLHYVNETKFPFSLYVTALNAGYIGRGQ